MQLFDANDLAAAALPPAPTVRVNGVEIEKTAITREIQHHPAPSASDAMQAATHALVVRELLLQQADRLEISADPQTDDDGRRETDDDSRIRQLLDREVTVPAPTEAECRRYYDVNRSRFSSPDIYEPAHILFPARVSDGQAYQAAIAAAAAAIEELTAQPERFETMARDLSACPSASSGGNLGQITQGQTTPEFEEAVMAMTPGTIAKEPVMSKYGVHVIRLDRRIDGQQLPFDLVKDEIADYLADRVFQRAVHQYISILAGQAAIEGVDLEAATSPLVQ
ncbi:peptidylprolyl isomerase [Fodinicurvata sp. EGI_FJ10296]|uniref:peptidylprolyl isomerase n=1 Tax=Fodinicurvata sp. EGI_FJ10296 TaxID=3231908 RepID=UPI00345705BD